MNRTERLLDLIALFLTSRRPIGLAELIQFFPDEYGPRPTDRDKCRGWRRFWRDRITLKALGYPIVLCAPRDLSPTSIDPVPPPFGAEAILSPVIQLDEADEVEGGASYVLDRRPTVIGHHLSHPDASILSEFALWAAQQPHFSPGERHLRALALQLATAHSSPPSGTPPKSHETRSSAHWNDLTLPHDIPQQGGDIRDTRDVERLRTCLAAIRWIRCHPGTCLQTLATLLGVCSKDLRQALQSLTLVGVPPFSPGDLVEVEVHRGRIHLRQLGALGEHLALSEEDVALMKKAAQATLQAMGDEPKHEAKKACLQGAVERLTQPQGSTLHPATSQATAHRKLHVAGIDPSERPMPSDKAA